MFPPIKQIVCTSTGEGGRNFIKIFGEYNKSYLHLTLRRLQTLDGRQEQRTFVAKILLRISHLDELHRSELQINWSLLEYIEGHH